MRHLTFELLAYAPPLVSNEADEQEYRQLRYIPPPGSTEILLVRHGESEPANPARPFALVDGQGDPALSPEGREQALRVGDRLALEQLDALYVTNLRRTAETAAPLAKRIGLEPMVERDLREVHLGEWEGGLYRKHVREGHPIALQMYAEERWDVIPGAEPGEQFRARVRAGIERIARAHVDQRVVAFTHGGVIGEVISIAATSRPFAFLGADNASVSHIVVVGERWLVRRFNDTAHLQPTFSVAAAPLT